MKIVSSTSDEEIAQQRATENLNHPLRTLAANLLRIVRGAGRPSELGRQMSDVIDRYIAYREAVGHWPPSETILEILRVSRTDNLDAWVASFRPGIDEASIDRSLKDGTYDRARADDEIVRAALQIAASKLVGQRLQEATGHNDLSGAIRALEAAQRKRQSKRSNQLDEQE